MNMFDRFQRNMIGFDSFNTWMRHYETIRAEMCKVLPENHPLAQDMGEEWLDLWLGLGELLRMDVSVVSWGAVVGWSPAIGFGTLAECLRDCVEIRSVASRGHLRIMALDGTIIKEWGPR